MRIAFPDCWDGDEPRQRRPPVAHHDRRRTVPGLAPRAGPAAGVRHPLPDLGQRAHALPGIGLDLSAHADFMNAWDQDKLEHEVRVCLNAGRICGVVSGRATG